MPQKKVSDDGSDAERAFGPRSVLRVMDILQALSTEPEGLTLAKLSEQLQLPKTSVFSLLKALEGGHYARGHDGRYTLGDQALKPGASLGHARACFDEAGHAGCSVTIAGPTARMLATRAHIEQLTLKAAEQISQILGFRGPYPPPERAAAREETASRRKR